MRWYESAVFFEDRQQLFDDGVGVLVGAVDGVADAVAEVAADDLLAHGAEAFLGGGDLGEHVDAVAVVVDHVLQTLDLAGDAAEAFLQGGVGLGVGERARGRGGGGGGGGRRFFLPGHDAARGRG